MNEVTPEKKRSRWAEISWRAAFITSWTAQFICAAELHSGIYVKHYIEQSSPKEHTKEPSGNFVTSLELLNDEPLGCTQRSSNVWATPNSNIEQNHLSDVSLVKLPFSWRCFEIRCRIISKMLLWTRISILTILNSGISRKHHSERSILRETTKQVSENFVTSRMQHVMNCTL